MADVEMKQTKETTDTREDEEVKDESKKAPPSPTSEIKSNIALIERAVSTLEPRFTLRVLRSLNTLRKKLDDQVLQDAIEDVYPSGRFAPLHHEPKLTIVRFTNQE